jgi:putative ABC transport system permease protein
MSVASRVRQELQRLDPTLPILKIDTVDDQLDDVLAPEGLAATFASLFGSLATLMACLGLYGVISYTVGQRTSEIGVRMALGATRACVFRMVLTECASS